MKAARFRARDNARTPMQWDATENAGFTNGIPWMRVNPNYLTINAAAQMADENSICHIISSCFPSVSSMMFSFMGAMN